MTSISIDTFRRDISLIYNHHGERTIRSNVWGRVYILILEDGVIVKSYTQSWIAKGRDNRRLPSPVTFALWLAAKREGLLDIEPKETP